MVPDLLRSSTKQNGLWPPSGTTDFQSVVWPTDWKSIVRLADGLEVHRTFGRRTGSPSYVWPTDWKSIVQRTIQPKGRHPRWCLAMDLVIGAIARQEANPTFDSCGCVDHCNHYLTRADCCILRLSGGLNFSPSISTLITTGGTPSTTMSKWQSEMSYNR